MALHDFLENLKTNNDYFGYVSTGLFNVELGNAAFRTEWVLQCECNFVSRNSLQYECESCGKSQTNNISITAGNGDGIYSVVSFTNRKKEVFAAAVLFDRGSKLALKFAQIIMEGEIQNFDPLPTIFEENLDGVEIGALEMSDGGAVLFSDESAGLDSSMATVAVRNWISGGIRAYAFVEDSLDSAAVAIAMGTSPDLFNGGLEGSLRPRVVLLVSDAYRKMHKNLANFEWTSEDLASQINAWSKQLVDSNLRNRSSDVIFWNARLSNALGSLLNDFVEILEMSILELSWYLQGAAFGNELCAENVKDVLNDIEEGFIGNGEEFELNSILALGYNLRGLSTQADSLD